MDKNTPTNQVQPPPGQHVANRRTERVCRNHKIVIQVWVRYSPPLSNWILESENETDEPC